MLSNEARSAGLYIYSTFTARPHSIIFNTLLLIKHVIKGVDEGVDCHLIVLCRIYCRYYLGRRPVVVIADPDILREVMVKQFSSFPNRMVRTWYLWTTIMSHQPHEHQPRVNFSVFYRLSTQTIRFATKPMTDCLLMLKNERWKRVRSILTPSFSAAKMKEVR